MRSRAIAGLGIVAVAVTAIAGSTSIPPRRPTSVPAASVATARAVAAVVSYSSSPTDLASYPPVVPVTPTAATPTPDGQPPITNLEPPPPCALGEVPTPLSRQTDWHLTLVDPDLMVPSTYVPYDLVGSDAAGFSPFFQVRAVMVPDLRRMGDAAAAAGASLGIASAYRSYDTQVWTFSYWVNELGYDYAILSSARAGHSEHQLGLAIDFQSYGGPEPWTYHNFATDTAAGAWLAANAWKYGFIMSYPYGSTPKSCYGFEPWHYRYFGVEDAALIHASGLTTREWMWRYQPNPERLSPMPTPLRTWFPEVPIAAPTAGANSSAGTGSGVAAGA